MQLVLNGALFASPEMIREPLLRSREGETCNTILPSAPLKVGN